MILKLLITAVLH